MTHVKFDLNELHEAILVAVNLDGADEIDDLVAAVQLLYKSQYNFGELLRQAVHRQKYANSTEYLESLRSERHDIVTHAILWAAWHGKYSKEDVSRALLNLEGFGLVEYAAPEIGRNTKNQSKEKKIRLTPEGTRVALSVIEGRRVLLRPRAETRTIAFVASAFGVEELDSLYHSELVPAIKKSGLRPFRVDLSEPHQSITDRILSGILECKVLIADLTHARPSVYFEVGLAHGLGIPMLLTCRQDHYRGGVDARKVHFDLEQYKISFWSKPEGKAFSWLPNMHPKDRLPKVLSDSHG